MKAFRIYCKKNKIPATPKGQNLFEIESLGVCLLIEVKTIGKKQIILDNNRILLSEKEIDILESVDDIKYVVFQFGSNFYYSKAEPNEEGDIPFKFNELKYLGVHPDADPDFINLAIHENYELLEGSHSPDKWIAKAKHLGMKSVGIISKNTLAGVIAFQTYCQKSGIKFILGETISIAYNYKQQRRDYLDNFPEDKKLEEFKPDTHDGIVYVMNQKGWDNLLLINYEINVENVKGLGDGTPTYITWEKLKRYSDGLVFVFPNSSILSYAVDSDDLVLYEELVNDHKETFKNCYFQFDCRRFHNNETDSKYLKYKKVYLDKFFNDIEPVLLNDTYFLEKEQHNIRKILNEIEKKTNHRSEENYFMSLRQYRRNLSALFGEDDDRYVKLLDRGLKSLKTINDICNFNIETGIARIPEFKNDYGISNDELFVKLCEEGLKTKIPKAQQKEASKRLDIELELFLSNDSLVSYMLIQWDICRNCVDDGIMVGAGRGSVVGSLVAYLIGMTTVNPLNYDLLFERFLNKTRVVPPNDVFVTLEDGTVSKYREDQIVKTKRGEVKAIDLTDKDEIV